MSFVDQGIDQRPEVLQAGGPGGAPATIQDSLVYYVKANGASQTVDPNSAFVTLMDNGGAVVVARTAAAIAANGKLSLTKTWDAASWTLQEDCIAAWEWTVGGTAGADKQYFDVVLNKLICPIEVSHLLESYPDLEQHLLAIGENDPTKFIKRAWSKFLVRIRSGHNRPSLILERDRLFDAVSELTLFLICRALSRTADDVWERRKTEHEEDYKAAVAALGELKYDRNEDGLAEQNEVKRINRRKFTV